MKLYSHPASTTSRPILMFCKEQGVDVEIVTVDLFTGEHKKPDYLKVNANGMVPCLEDDGFVLTESAAILRYLADKVGSPAYPKDLKARARVDEAIDWFNTNLYRELGYHLVYPQAFPNHARATEALTQSVLDWGLDRAKGQLEVLDGGTIMLRDGSRFLCGNDITIADYLGAELLGCGDLIGINWNRYPNVARWVATMKARPAWAEVHEVIDGFAKSIAGKTFTTIA